MAASKFKDIGLIADLNVLPPGETLKISFGSNEVNLGNNLTPTQVKDRPTLSWTAEEGALYTLCMTDPDAPSRAEPTFREWHHWLVINIPGSDVPKGFELSQYVGSGPPQGTGLHRYVFLVYKQPNELKTDVRPNLTNRSAEGRGKFKICDFASSNKLGNSPIVYNPAPYNPAPFNPAPYNPAPYNPASYNVPVAMNMKMKMAPPVLYYSLR